MPISKCPRCSKLFSKEKLAVCQDCLPVEEEDYLKVRAELAKNPSLNAPEAAVCAKVELAVVTRMLESGLLTTDNYEGNNVTCGRCGAPAISLAKRLCPACLDKLNRDIGFAQQDIMLAAKEKNAVPAPETVQQVLEKKRNKI